jgi:hypothetical protein
VLANASGIEIAWTVGAACGLAFTAALALWSWLRFRIIREGVDRGKVVKWGARWNLLLALLVAMVFFGIGWIGYLAIGFVAMATPPPIAAPNQEAADLFAKILIGMEASHALGQLALFLGFLSLAGRRMFRPTRYLRFARRA